MDRRRFTCTAMACLAPKAAWGEPAVGGKVERFPLAITDITVRKELQRDFGGTVKILRNLGYTHLGSRLHSWNDSEPPELRPSQKAQLLSQLGMKIGAVRLTPKTAWDLSLSEELEGARILGASVVVLTTAPIFFNGQKRRVPSTAEISELLRKLDKIGAAIGAAGMKFAWHNHDADEVVIDGVRVLDRIISETNPDLVCFELDLAWAHIGGYDPVALARSMGKRLVSLHLKDVDPRKGPGAKSFVPPGDGEMNYASLLPQIRKLTRALPAVEVDAPADGIAAAARAINFIRSV